MHIVYRDLRGRIIRLKCDKLEARIPASDIFETFSVPNLEIHVLETLLPMYLIRRFRDSRPLPSSILRYDPGSKLCCIEFSIWINPPEDWKNRDIRNIPFMGKQRQSIFIRKRESNSLQPHRDNSIPNNSRSGSNRGWWACSFRKNETGPRKRFRLRFHAKYFGKLARRRKRASVYYESSQIHL